MDLLYSFAQPPTPESAPLAAAVLPSLLVALALLVVALRTVAGHESFRLHIAAFRRLPRPAKAGVLALLAAAIAYGGSKPHSSHQSALLSQSPSEPESAEGAGFSESQLAAGFALASVSGGDVHDFSAPPSASVHRLWRLRGASSDDFALNPPGWSFRLGDGTADVVRVFSSGFIAAGDASIEPLRTVLGIVPEANWRMLPGAAESLFWHDVTGHGSARFTWLNALYGRETNAPVSFQAELYRSGDFTFRYALQSLPSGAQAGLGAWRNGGGEEFTHIPLNALTTAKWAYIADLDHAGGDTDGDGVPDSDEVLVHHTDPRSADTDLDGIGDAQEIASGSNPLGPDTDGDRLPDGSDPDPLTWNDPASDADGDGILLADELANGLDPEVDDSIDTDGDGWPDWKEKLAVSDPENASSRPIDPNGAPLIFDVTISMDGAAPDCAVAVSVGTRRIVFAPPPPAHRMAMSRSVSGASFTLTLPAGQWHDVSLYAAEDCAVALGAQLGPPYAIFLDRHPVFSGGSSLRGGVSANAGSIALPLITATPPDWRHCFHSKDPRRLALAVAPLNVPASTEWYLDGRPVQEGGLEFSVQSGIHHVSVDYMAEGAEFARSLGWHCTVCNLVDNPPSDDAVGYGGGQDPGEEPPHEQCHQMDPLGGEPRWYVLDSIGTGTTPGFIVPVNNDDDDASLTDDRHDENTVVKDNDLVAYYPMGLYDGSCCNCPEHQPEQQSVDTMTLVGASTGLALWADACRSNAFSGTVHAGGAVYVEGLNKSASPGADSIVWEYTQDAETHVSTNAVTVLSQRIFADLDFDGYVEASDKALHPSLSPEFGWSMPIAPGTFRVAQLQTDVGLEGMHILTISGGTSFRVWRSPNPSTNDTPLLVAGQSVTNGLGGISWNTTSTDYIYIQALSNGTATLTYAFIGTGTASRVVSRASLKMTAVRFGLVPDYDRDGSIDSMDVVQAHTNRVLRWWINDDADADRLFTGASGVPGQTPGNHADDMVNGRGDLVDFFPVWLDIQEILKSMPPDRDYQYTLRHPDGAVKAVYTDLVCSTAGRFLVVSDAVYGSSFDQGLHAAAVFHVSSSGVQLENDFLDRIRDDAGKGVLLLEGAAKTSRPLILEIRINGMAISEASMPMSISGVEDMYRRHNFREDATIPESLGEPTNRPDLECTNMDVFLAHGFLVKENESRAWGAEFFKRLWQEGMNARFHSVTWTGDSGTTISYEGNVNQAFVSSSNYAARVNAVKTANQSEIVMLAHSLGCMLTSAAIADHGMQAGRFFALNGAVPSEAFDGAMADNRTNALNRLLHPEWRGYAAHTWSANWHSLFTDSAAFPEDDRADLKWRGRFADAAPVLYNFWSSGDEVLEIAADANISLTSGLEWDWEFDWWPVSVNARRFVWHKQALFKGRSGLYGTIWAGWGFWEWDLPLVGKVYSKAEANALTDDMLRAAPVFRHNPDEMFSSNIVVEVRNNLLARGIPELSFPIGYTNVVNLAPDPADRNFDMHHKDFRRNDDEWPQRDIDFNDRGDRPNRWLHSDLINLPHYYTHKLFKKLVEEGDMK